MVLPLTEFPYPYIETQFHSIPVNCPVSALLIIVCRMLVLNLDLCLSPQTGVCCWENTLCTRLAGSCVRHVACVEFQPPIRHPSSVPAWSPWSPRGPLWSCQVRAGDYITGEYRLTFKCAFSTMIHLKVSDWAGKFTLALKTVPITNHSAWFYIKVINVQHSVWDLFQHSVLSNKQ